MNFVGALIFLPLLAVLPNHTSTSVTSLKPSLTDQFDSIDWHKIHRLWINAGNLNTDPEILYYIQLIETIERLGLLGKYNISLGEKSTLLQTVNHVNSSENSTNNATRNYLHLLAGRTVRTFCNNLVPLRRSNNSEEYTELQTNETVIRRIQGCHNVADRLEKEPFSIEIMKFLDLISNPGLLSENTTLTSNQSSISIEWGLENPEVGILFDVTAYNVSYCPLRKPNEWSCNGDWKKRTVEAKNGILKTTIADLEANRKYKVVVISLFKNGMQASQKRYKYIHTKKVYSNGSVMAIASHTMCATFSALLLFFSW